MSEGALSPSVEALVAASAALASRDPGALARFLERADAVAEAAEVEEAILQSYLFLGYPVALNAFALWREVSGRPAPPPAADAHAWEARGRDVCRTVYGGQYEGLRENIRRLHPDMERWMVVEGYGKVLGRPGLALDVRELCIVALLAVLDAPRQLYSHLRGALNAGASEAAVEGALELAAGSSTPEVASRARATWDRVRERRRG